MGQNKSKTRGSRSTSPPLSRSFASASSLSSSCSPSSPSNESSSAAVMNSPTSMSTRGDSNSRHRTASSWSRRKAEELFNRYAGTQPQIGPEELMRLCGDIGVDAEHDVGLLVFSWKCGAKSMGYYTKDEWLRGMESVRADTLAGMRDKLAQVTREVLSDVVAPPSQLPVQQQPQQFKQLYQYAFQFSKESEDAKVIDATIASGLIQLLLTNTTNNNTITKANKQPQQTSVTLMAMRFRDFLGGGSVKAMNMDQWMSLLEFCQTVYTDLSNYDSESAWPCMLDDFVSWMRREKKLPNTTTDPTTIDSTTLSTPSQ